MCETRESQLFSLCCNRLQQLCVKPLLVPPAAAIAAAATLCHEKICLLRNTPTTLSILFSAFDINCRGTPSKNSAATVPAAVAETTDGPPARPARTQVLKSACRGYCVKLQSQADTTNYKHLRYKEKHQRFAQREHAAKTQNHPSYGTNTSSQ